MKHRYVGGSDLQVSTICFGAWAIGGWMWGGTDKKDSLEAIRASWDAGVTSIDTAPIYGMGLSEVLVAEALEGIPRDQVQLLTKCALKWESVDPGARVDGYDMDGNPVRVFRHAGKESILRECEDSLRRLKTDYIDLYQVHWHDASTPIDETMEALVILLDQGKIRQASVCNYDDSQLDEALKNAPIIANQVPYSMVLRGIEERVVPYCIQHSLGILAYSPLQRGLLTGKIKEGHAFPEGDHRDGNKFFQADFVRKTNQFLDSIRPIAEGKGASLTQLVLAWTLSQPGISTALVGARNAEQARHNAMAADLHLDDDDIAVISAHLFESGL
jgi:aryl-alcohol dehydrogenase-like predicted oxidoreductase